MYVLKLYTLKELAEIFSAIPHLVPVLSSPIPFSIF